MTDALQMATSTVDLSTIRCRRGTSSTSGAIFRCRCRAVRSGPSRCRGPELTPIIASASNMHREFYGLNLPHSLLGLLYCSRQDPLLYLPNSPFPALPLEYPGASRTPETSSHHHRKSQFCCYHSVYKSVFSSDCSHIHIFSFVFIKRHRGSRDVFAFTN